MGRFKAPAPAPPTPARGMKTPMKASVSKKNSRTESDLSLVAMFDDLMRNGSIFYDGAEKEFLQFVNLVRDWRKKWQYAETERSRLSVVLADKDKEIMTKEYQIKQARKMVDEERRQRLNAEDDRERLSKQIGMIKSLITADGAKTLTNETLEQIYNIDSRPIASNRTPRNGGGHGRNQNHIQHHNDEMEAVVEQSAESLLDASDLSFDETRDDGLDGTRLRSGHIYKRRSSTAAKLAVAAAAEKKRRSRQRRSHSMGGEKIKATTTVTVDDGGHTHAESVIESYPVQMTREELDAKLKKSRKSREAMVNFEPSAPPMTPRDRVLRAVNGVAVTPGSAVSVKRTFSNVSSMPSRPHSFQKKTVVVVEKCNPCGKRIKFGKSVYKCRDCGAVCHLDCRHDVPLPCIAGAARTPTNRTGNFLADFAPSTAPMIPAILVHCIKEIEARGLNETGLWRMSGGEREANEILDKFMVKGGGPPKLNNYQVHDITSCVKKFLRGLKEAVIPLTLHRDFVDAATNPDTTDGEAALYQAISELPLPNRDTLAFLMLHLQTVASNSLLNKMDASNLARILGPTILGYATNDPVSEAPMQQSVVSTLIGISSDYWSRFLAVDQENLFGYLNTKSATPETRYFAPLTSPLAPPTRTGGPAKRTRSKQHHPGSAARGNLFQSPMIF